MKKFLGFLGGNDSVKFWLEAPNGSYQAVGLFNDLEDEFDYTLNVYSNNLFSIVIEEHQKFVSSVLYSNEKVYLTSTTLADVYVYPSDVFKDVSDLGRPDLLLDKLHTTTPEKVVDVTFLTDQEAMSELGVGQFGFANLKFALELN